MLKDENLKPVEEVMEEYGLSPDENDCNPNEEIKYYEITRKGNLILYGYEDNTGDSIVPKELVNELFPEYETNLHEGYLIEENGKFYV